jgi:hypothetical protein
MVIRWGVPLAAPWVITAAVSKDQTRNTMRLFPSLLTDACVEEYGLDIHQPSSSDHQRSCAG